MLSCDTLAVTARFCAQGSNTMAKNSDRPLGEAQPLIWFPPQDHGGWRNGGVHLYLHPSGPPYLRRSGIETVLDLGI